MEWKVDRILGSPGLFLFSIKLSKIIHQSHITGMRKFLIAFARTFHVNCKRSEENIARMFCASKII